MKTENRTAEEELKTLVFKFCEWRTDKGHCFKSLSHPPSLNDRWYQFQKETNAIDEFVKESQSTIKVLVEALELLKHSIDFAEQEHNASYVITVEDKRIIESILSKVKL